LQHELLEAGGSLDAVFFCSCHPREECDCLMPNPGMLLDIGARLRISLEDVAFICGSDAAVQAARAAGARPILVDAATDAAHEPSHAHDLERYADLDSAVASLLAEKADA
jgi:D-glycero-D-manno-heptose 1,7-bisphosphate phosphatase